VGLLGWPVEHSASPAMQNAAFAELGMDWAYVPLPVRPGEVEAALEGLPALGFVGCNVTVPHKETVVRFMKELSDAARIIGAVNLIHIRDGSLHGLNTEPTGFLNSLDEACWRPRGKRVALLGAGGAARPVVYALASAGAHSVTVIDRSPERAAALVEQMIGLFRTDALSHRPLTRNSFVALGKDVDLVVNTTTAGMLPNPSACPWPEDVPMPRGVVYYDLIYNPLDNEVLRRGRLAGGEIMNGLGMLVHQGRLAFEEWTGRSAPMAVMRRACLGQDS
jgi:shikimate dehydrogenase